MIITHGVYSFGFDFENRHDFAHGRLVLGAQVQRFVPSKSVHQLWKPQHQHVVTAHIHTHTEYRQIYNRRNNKTKFRFNYYYITNVGLGNKSLRLKIPRNIFRIIFSSFYSPSSHTNKVGYSFFYPPHFLINNHPL